MAEVNPDLEGATPEEESSEELGQVTEPTLTDVIARMDKMERGWEERFDRVFNGMQSTTQREVGRVAAQLVAVEGQLGEVLTRSEITRRVMEQGYDKDVVDRVTAAVTQERKEQQIDAREQALRATPRDGIDYGRLWAAADQRLLDHAHSEGMLSTSDLAELLDAQGNPREGHEEEMAWFRSLITPVNAPASLELYERIERETRRKITDAAEKKATARKRTPASPPNNRPLSTSTRDYTKIPLKEITDDEYAKNRDAIALAVVARNRR